MPKKGEPKVDRELCKACGICIAFCPQKVLAPDTEGIPVVARPDACNACQLCFYRCPDFAIEVEEVVAEMAARLLPQYNGIYIQMEDELASIAAIIGASLSGMKSFTATSGPGFSLMQENLGLAIMAEVPCVIINVMRFGLSTGIATKPGQGDVLQVRWGTHGDHGIIALVPSSVQECYDLTVEAFNLAERFRTPVVLLTDASLAHLREKVIVKPPLPGNSFTFSSRYENLTCVSQFKRDGDLAGSL